MIKSLTSHPITKSLRKAADFIVGRVQKIGQRGDRRGLALKIFMCILAVGLGLLFNRNLVDYIDVSRVAEQAPESVSAIVEFAPTKAALIWQGIGVFLAIMAFLTSLWINDRMEEERRGGFIVMVLWISAFAGLLAWLPIDVLATKHAIAGKALAGENPSIPAYLGKLFFVSIVILSIPASAMIYFRLSLMDRYVVHSFLSPFSFCLFSFISIWVIADLTDNAPAFSGLPASRMLTFYVVQVPYVVLFVMPIAVLLSALFSLSKMSKSNEFISMIGSGRSVLRILAPIFIIGAYSSLITLAFKYEWAPSSVGYSEALMETAKREQVALKTGTDIIQDVWAKSEGWMHVNEVDRRTWFVGKVPFVLSEEMADVVVWQLRDDDQPEKVWKAERAKWVWDAMPPKWVLTNAQIWSYNERQVPIWKSYSTLEITNWSETPWKVLSSSQNPDYLGLPGLTMYLNAHSEAGDEALAKFRTNWWYIFSEPLTCLALIMVAAPLGIVYSRKGVMGGVAAAIIVFALMYVMRGSFIALGHRGVLPPFFAAWGTNTFVAAIGVFLLWYRARNREVPKFKEFFGGLLEKVGIQRISNA